MKTLLPCAAIVLTVLGCGRSCCAPAVKHGGWLPDWIDAPPRLDVDLEIKPMKWAPVDTVDLKWKFEQDKSFGYEARNKVRIVKQSIKKGPGESETQGTIMFRPLEAGQAEVVMSTHLVTGAGSPTTKTFIMDRTGQLQTTDPATQTMFLLIFPVTNSPVTPGESTEIEIVFPSGAKNARTIATTILGIVGFSRVEGRKCAVVALDHEAHILARNKATGQMQETGSVTNLQLIGYFDIKAGRYMAVAIGEKSVTVHKAGETRTTRSATYILRGLAGS